MGNFGLLCRSHGPGSLPLLLTLECRVTYIDTHEDRFRRLPDSPILTLTWAEDLFRIVDQVTEHALVMLMTLGHQTNNYLQKSF